MTKKIFIILLISLTLGMVFFGLFVLTTNRTPTGNPKPTVFETVPAIKAIPAVEVGK